MKQLQNNLARCCRHLERHHWKPFHRLAWAGIIFLATGCASYRQVPMQHTPEASQRIASKQSPRTDLLPSVVSKQASKPSRDMPVNLEGLINWALEVNQGLQSSWEQWQANLEAIPQASALPDPMIRYGYFIREVETRVGPQQQRVGLAQTFPWFGKRALATSMASEQAIEAWSDYLMQKRNLIREVRSLWADWEYLTEATAITRDNIQLVRRLEQVAQARLRSGKDALGVVQAQLTLARLEEQILALIDRKGPIQARLNGLLNRPSDTELPSFMASTSGSTGDWEIIESETAWAEHPRILQKQAVIRRYEAATQLARKQRRPQFTLGLDLIQTDSTGNMNGSDMGKDPVMVSAMFNLPIWERKNRAAVAQAEAKEASARHALVEAMNQLNADRSKAQLALSDAVRRQALHQDTLRPLAESALQVAEQAYRTGQSTFQEWINALQLLLELELSQLRAQTDQKLAHANLEQLLGTVPEARALTPVNPTH
jgi:cobalt-zinc-cadmium efflux system outer membrane protein